MNILVVEDEAVIALWLAALVGQSGHRLAGTYVTANRAFALTYRTRAIGFIEKPLRDLDVLEAISFVDQLRSGLTGTTPRGLILFDTPEARRAQFDHRLHTAFSEEEQRRNGERGHDHREMNDASVHLSK
jgi:hypothetical protein